MANAPVPPHDLAAEEYVLGSIMLSSNAVDLAVEEMAVEDFYRESHRKVFAAALALHMRDEPTDAIAIADVLKHRGELDNIGGSQRLHELASIVPAWKNVAHYARIVREQAVLRALIDTGSLITRLGWEGEEEVPEKVEKAQELVFDLAQQRARSEFTLIGVEARAAFDQLITVYEQGKEVIGVPTGFHHLDGMTAGLQPGNLIVLAGRPSMGKSALALGIAQHVTMYEKLPVALFTPEMSSVEVTHRLISLEGFIDSHKLRTGKLTSEDWKNVTHAVGKIEQAPLHIDDNGAVTMLEVRAHARKLKLKEPNLALVIVDYIQLMSSGGSNENRVQEVSQISRSLKVLARELDVPVLALSQLSRGPEQRHDKRPLLSDLRESGSIEQDADVVMFVYRDEYYNPEDPDVEGIAEVIIAKHRNGPTGTVKLTFVNHLARFSDPALLGVVG